MKVKLTAGVIILSLAGVLGLMVYDVSHMSPETVILCSLNEGGILIPSEFCEYYMFNFRDAEDDVLKLSAGAGLGFILEGNNNEKKYEIAEFFVVKGLDVNGVNHSGGYNLTPLHGAVIDNDIVMAVFLLDRGASKKIKAPTINMDPLELAKSLQKKEPNIDRSKMINLLTD